MKTPGVPLPSDWLELEHYIARLARDFLQDPHAKLYGEQGGAQYGLDVLAVDRRPGGSGKLWAFQAKDYRAKKLQPRALEDIAKLLQSFPDRRDLRTFVVVTTARVSPQVDAKAHEIGKRLGLEAFAVWDWEHFSDHLIRYCGAGPWLAASERERLRQSYCARVIRDFDDAGPLHPLRLPEDGGLRLADLLVTPVLQPDDGADAEPTATRSSSIMREGHLVEWIDLLKGEKPLVLILAPMGAGKSVVILQAAAQLAQRLATVASASLPVRISAAQLADRRLDDAISQIPDDALGALWRDPMSSWVLLVDGLDEVSERTRPAVEQEILNVSRRRNVVATVVTCRTTHLRPRMLPRSIQLRVRPWNVEDAQRLLSSVAHAREPHARSRRQGAPEVDPALLENPLSCTLLALHHKSDGASRPSRAQLFRKLTDGMFRTWATRDRRRHWERLRIAFERVALAAIKAGGRPISEEKLEAALSKAAGSFGIETIVEIAERELGLIRRIGSSGWEFSFRAIAEYLAAGALLRRTKTSLQRLSARPWAVEMVRLALDRRSGTDRRYVLETVRGLLSSQPEDDPDVQLCRLLLAARVVRDLGARAAPVIEETATRLVAAAADESSAWRRRMIGNEVRPLAEHGGPLWKAVWRRLLSKLQTTDSRVAWVAMRDDDDPEFWRRLIREEDVAVRGIATGRLARWSDRLEVLLELCQQLHDVGHEPGVHAPPSSMAGIAIRDVPRGSGFALVKPLALFALYSGHQLSRGAGALALHPGEAPTEDLLEALRMLALAVHHPAIVAAVDALRRQPGAQAWLEKRWPDSLQDGFASKMAPQPSPPAGPIEPPSWRTRADLVEMIAPAFRLRTVRSKLVSSRPNLDTVRAICAVARTAPAGALELLSTQEDLFFPLDAQEDLGAAALQHAGLAKALVERWIHRLPSHLTTSYPGLALERLAARGDADAVDAYFDWLPSNIHMNPLIPSYRPPLRATLLQPKVREGARRLARHLWDEMSTGQLHVGTLVNYLYGLWPAWEDDPVVRDGLIEWSRSDDEERFDVAVRTWLNGVYPPPVADAIATRLRSLPADPLSVVDAERLAIWFAAAEKAGILTEFEPMLIGLVESPHPPPFLQQMAVYLADLRPDRRVHWSAKAAESWPAPEYAFHPRADRDEERLVAVAPRTWAQACLRRLERDHLGVALPFLRVSRILCHLMPPSKLRRCVISSVRELVEHDLAWQQTRDFGRCVRVGDAARELLFEL
jgi:hypothetical protein